MKIYQEDHKFISNIKDYKYTAVDKSILSKYILRHYWNYAIKFMPRNIAPNVITMFGLFCMLTSTFLTIFFNPELNLPNLNWLCLVNAFLLFLYSTFDALDGKQAVRTKSSSPLGQMFDHVVDSLVVGMIGITLSSSLKFGLTPSLIFLTSFIYLGFYGATIYEKIAEKMELGYINGPSEGVFLVISIHLICYLNNSFFNILNEYSTLKILKRNLKYSTILFLVITALYLISLVYNLICVSGRRFKEYAPHLLMVIELIFIGLVLSQMKIFSEAIFGYLIIFTYMFVFSYINAEIIFSRVRNCDIPAFPSFLYCFLMLPGMCLDESRLNFARFVIVLEFLFALSSFVTRMCSICWVMAEALNIQVFSLPKEKEN